MTHASDAHALRLPGDFLARPVLLVASLLVEGSDSIAGFLSERVPRIALEELLEGTPRPDGIFQVVVVDLRNGEQRLKAVFAARVFAPQELVLADSIAQRLGILECPSGFHHQLSHRDYAGIGLW